MIIPPFSSASPLGTGSGDRLALFGSSSKCAEVSHYTTALRTRRGTIPWRFQWTSDRGDPNSMLCASSARNARARCARRASPRRRGPLRWAAPAAREARRPASPIVRYLASLGAISSHGGRNREQRREHRREVRARQTGERYEGSQLVELLLGGLVAHEPRRAPDRAEHGKTARGDVTSFRKAGGGASPAMASAFGLGSAAAEDPVGLDQAKRGNRLIAYLEAL